MMTEQINSFCGQTVSNKEEGSEINANLIQEHSISKVYNSHKEIQKIQRLAIQKMLQNCFRKLEKHLPPKGSRCAPVLESDFLKQGFTFSIMVQFFLAVEEPIVFKIRPILSNFPKVLSYICQSPSKNMLNLSIRLAKGFWFQIDGKLTLKLSLFNNVKNVK